MSLTSFPNGISSFGVPVVGPFISQGKYIFVKPYSGLDGNSGLSPDTAVKTLTKALALATANKNDVVVLFAEGNSAAATTDYQSVVLDWNKDGVHLIGANAGPRFSHRSRIAAISTFDDATTLVTVSANGCLFANIEMFLGVAGTSPTGCLKITGMRNKFYNCHIAGIGHDNNDIADASSVWFATGASENYFKDCVIGVDTIGRGTGSTVSEIRFTNSLAGGAASNHRNIFEDCIIVGLCHTAGNYNFIKASVNASACGRFLLLKNCIFANPGASAGGVEMTAAFLLHATLGGWMIMHNCTVVGAAILHTAETANIIMGAGTTAGGMEATDCGVGVVYNST
jgi:hypothetical protein